MKQETKIYKALKEGIVGFDGAHNIHTPQKLVEEILSKINLNGNILVMFNVEFVISLVYTSNIAPENITFYSDHNNKSEICSKMGVKYITNLETDMKFDVVLANPPYKQGLFREFMRKCLADLLNDNGVLVQISPDETEGKNRKNEKTKQLMVDYGLQQIIPAAHFFKGVVTSAPIITYFFDKSKEFNESILDKELTPEEALTKTIIGKIISKKATVGHLGHKTVGNPPIKGDQTLVRTLSSITKDGPVWEDLPKDKVRYVDNGKDLFFTSRFFGMNPVDYAYKGKGPLYISTRIYGIENANGYSEDEFNAIFNCKEVKFLLKHFRGSNTFCVGWSLREIPLIPKKTADISLFFNLTTEEKKHIINVVG